MVVAGSCGAAVEEASPNLILNGSFTDNIDGWYPAIPDEMALTHGASGQTSPGGRLIVTPGGTSGTAQQTYFLPNGNQFVALGDAESVDIVAYAKGGGGVEVGWIRYAWTDSIGTELGHDTAPSSQDAAIAANTWSEVSRRGVAVPPGSYGILIAVNSTRATSALPVSWSDVYVGPPDEDVPPYPADTIGALIANRFPNGDFELGVANWSTYWGNEVISAETGSPIAGAKSMKIVTNGESSEEGAYLGSSTLVALGGESLRLRAKLKGTGNVKIDLVWYGTGGFEFSHPWSGTLSGSVTDVNELITAPSGAVFVQPQILSNTGSFGAPITFYVDDLSLGAP